MNFKTISYLLTALNKIIQKILMKTHLVKQTTHNLKRNIKNTLKFELKGGGWDLSLMSYKLTKRTEV